MGLNQYPSDYYNLQGSAAKDYASCLQTYLLLKYGKVRDESEDTPVPYGTLGYNNHNERLYSCQI